MNNFQPMIGRRRRLTKLEWKALQAALPCQGGVPVVPGLRECLPAEIDNKELFVLKGACTRDISTTFYVLLGWEDDDDVVLPYSYPEIFAIYADDSYRGPLPSFDELYRRGVDELRGYACMLVARDTLLAMVVTGVTAAIVILSRSPGGTFLNIVGIAAAGVFGGVVSWMLSRKRRLGALSTIRQTAAP